MHTRKFLARHASCRQSRPRAIGPNLDAYKIKCHPQDRARAAHADDRSVYKLSAAVGWPHIASN